MVRWISIVVLNISAVYIAGCSQHTVDSEKGCRMSDKTIEQVQEEYTDKWMAIDGVEGIAIGVYHSRIQE